MTGAAGDVGREVVRHLVKAEVDVRAADAELERVHVHEQGRDVDVEVAQLWLQDPTSFAHALDGAQALFLTRPSNLGDARPLFGFIDEALRAGVEHVVFLSVAGAAENPLVPHHPIEQHIRARTPAFTILRPGFFCQALGSVYRQDLAEDGRLYAPAGRARVAFVDGRDVAEVAARILVDPGPHREKAYTLTGPEAISFEDAARLLSLALGRPIRYEAASVVDYARHLRQRGLPLTQIAAETVLHVGLRYGQAEQVDETLPLLLGRHATTFERYLRDHAHLWAPGGGELVESRR